MSKTSSGILFEQQNLESQLLSGVEGSCNFLLSILLGGIIRKYLRWLKENAARLKSATI